MSTGVYVRGVSVQGVSVHRGICPGGKCPGGYMSRGKCPGGTCPGGTCPGGGGGYVLEPFNMNQRYHRLIVVPIVAPIVPSIQIKHVYFSISYQWVIYQKYNWRGHALPSGYGAVWFIPTCQFL